MKQINEDVASSLLRIKFKEALIFCRANLSNVEFANMWRTIEKEYSGRAYHNLDHIEYCIDRIEDLKNIGFVDLSNGIIRIALIFHDIAQEGYDLVQESVSSFDYWLGDHIDSDICSSIQNCILATDHFNDKSFQPTIEAYIVKDSDLAILGTLWFDTYLNYQKQIMIEAKKAGMFEENYYIARKDFLIKMLAVPKIYQTWDFGSVYEWTARNNLQRELQSITDRNEEGI